MSNFPDELAVMEAEAAGDPLGHGHAMLAIQLLPPIRSSRWRRRAKVYALAVLGWLSIAAIVLGAAAVLYGVSR